MNNRERGTETEWLMLKYYHRKREKCCNLNRRVHLNMDETNISTIKYNKNIN